MDLMKTIDILENRLQSNSTSVNAVGASAGNISTETQQTTGAEFSTFLTLLTAQIKNQDPLAPLDSTQFVEQLATFSNLEFQAKSNQSLELIAALLVRQIELIDPPIDPAPTPQTP